jgi:hypothetical protein
MTPNDIIAALLDVASAAFRVQHGSSEFMQQTHADTEDMGHLRDALRVLDQLPQPANQPPLTPSAKARHYMQSFLQGAPVRIGSEEFSAALILSGLNENVGQPAPRGFGNPSAAEINDITMDTLGKWPSFEAQSWACKVVTAVAEKLRSQDIAAARDKLLADTASEAHKIWNDAELLASLRRLCGYVENGSSEPIGISQDDATNEWVLRVGPAMSPRARHFHARSFHQVIRLAADDMLENETCKFCGFEVEFPCDEPPPDICSAAIRAAEKQKRAKPEVKVTANVAGAVKSFNEVAAAVKESSRDLMKATLIQLKDEASAETAKRIIAKVGGVQKMMDIPDEVVVAVTIAASDRIALERRLKVLRAEGNLAAVEALLRGVDEVPAVPQPKVEGDDPMAMARLSVAIQQESREPMPALPAWPPLEPIIPPVREDLGQSDQVQGQGGEFDGGGASGDFQ